MTANFGGYNQETDLCIDVQRMYRFETDRPLKAFVDIVVNGVLLIKGFRVMDGRNGLFVSMPREQAKDQKWYDSVRCLTQDVKDQITEVVMKCYNDERDNPEALDEDIIINN